MPVEPNGKPSKGNWQSVCLHNQTAIPMVYVISHLSPLCWGVLQPNEKVQRKTGRFYFTITAYPYNGQNEPDTSSVVKSHLSDIAMIGGGLLAILGLLSGSDRGNAMAMSFGGTAAGMAVRRAVKSCRGCEMVDIDGDFLIARLNGYLADGTWLHILGGPIVDGDPYRLFLSVFPCPVLQEGEENGKRPPWLMDVCKAGVKNNDDTGSAD